jgi:hypothetical protein
MLLTDLDPKWMGEHVFSFLCPHCKLVRLHVKNVPMHEDDQNELFFCYYGHLWNDISVPMNESQFWKFSSRYFSDMTVTPSIDAHKAGHWHGSITKGVVLA